MAGRPQWLLSAALFTILASSGAPRAQSPPVEVTGLTIDSLDALAWQPAAGGDDYNLYRGALSRKGFEEGAVCHGDEIAATSFASPANPTPGGGFYYLVTAESNTDGEGTAGTGAAGARILRGACDPVMRAHVLNRLGYGWSEWARDRYLLLGRQGYIDEQLAPETIDESGNVDLITRSYPFIPPETNFEFQGLDVVQAAYSRRQLEQQAALFWDNHFNSDYRTSFMFFGFYPYTTRAAESVKAHYDAFVEFRTLAFNGTFREIVEASALSPAMILFLDTASNVAGVPNENFARELLELHTMGVDGGYVQQDIVELARVFTGWNVCKKRNHNAGDPLAACIPSSQIGGGGEPAGEWVRNFRVSLHDSGQKVLFAGTPHQAFIPSTAATPVDGIDDVAIALDAVVAHPSTPRFIARKLLQRFVTEEPAQAMIDAVVAAWNDGANPRSVGDLREILRAVLAQSEFVNPDQARGKIKTPFEHVVSALRAARGKTDGLTLVRDYLIRMSELLHENPIPTGYSELGGDWIDTNNLIERQNFGLDITSRNDFAFGADIIAVVNAAGVSTAPVPDNSAAIVSFFAEVLFGGGIAPAERQRAIAYLTTNAGGSASPYDDSRIRETLGFMMGYAQFMEQ